MRLEGNDVVEGLKEWLKAEVKEGPRQGYDLGKFFFTVSVGTLGGLATLEKLNTTSRIDKPMIVSIVVLFLSMLVAINLARPRRREFSGNTDLLVEYTKRIKDSLIHMWIWFGLWLVGTLIGGYAVTY